MQLGCRRSELEHRAQHGHALASGCVAAAGVREELERRARGMRVGVVRIVDEQRASDPLDARSHRWHRHAQDAARGVLHRDADLARDRQRQRRVPKIVRAAQWHADLDVVRRQLPASLGVERPTRNRHVAAIEACSDDAASALARFRHNVGLARRNDRDGDAVAGCHLFAQYTLEVAQPLEMLLADRRHDDDARLDYRAQRSDLPGLVRSHLDDGDVGVIGNREQRLRNADEIVEIALCGVHFQPAIQRGADQLFRACLAVRAHHGDDGAIPCLPPEAPQRAERCACVAHVEDGNAEALRGVEARDHDRGRSGFHGVREKVMRIEALAGQRDEKIATLNRPRVGPHATQQMRAARQLVDGVARECIRDAVQGPERRHTRRSHGQDGTVRFDAHARTRVNSATMIFSSNGSLSVPRT